MECQASSFKDPSIWRKNSFADDFVVNQNLVSLQTKQALKFCIQNLNNSTACAHEMYDDLSGCVLVTKHSYSHLKATAKLENTSRRITENSDAKFQSLIFASWLNFDSWWNHLELRFYIKSKLTFFFWSSRMNLGSRITDYKRLYLHYSRMKLF